MSYFKYFTSGDIAASTQLRIAGEVVGTPRIDPTETDSVFQVIEHTINGWDRALESADEDLKGLSSCQWELGGSLATGTFWGPKDRRFSWNSSNIPRQFEHLIEVDVRLLLPDGLSPHDDTVLRLLSNVVGSQGMSPKLVLLRWGVEVPAVGIYAYAPWTQDIAIEFEVSLLQRGSHFEIASVWRDLFTLEEILSQTLRREYLRGFENGSEILALEKTRQIAEARWRFISLLAITRLTETKTAVPAGLLEKMRSLTIPASVTALVDRWLDGEQVGQGLERPIARALEPIAPHAEQFLDTPAAPDWIMTAMLVQRACIRSSSRGF